MALYFLKTLFNIIIVKTGVENLSAFVPTKISAVEKTIKEKGLTEFRPAKSLPLKKN